MNSENLFSKEESQPARAAGCKNLGNWEAHRHCVICGTENSLGIGLKFVQTGAEQIESEWSVEQQYQGYQGLLQGGITSALLDSVMVNCLRFLGVEAYTAELTVRYVAPVPVGSKVTLLGWREKTRRHLHWMRAELWSKGQIMASAQAKFMNRS